MAIIGTFKASENGFVGILETLAIKSEINFQPLERKPGAKSPDFRVFVFKNNYELGAAWKKSSRSGTPYLSVSLDDPSFPAPIDCRLVKTEHGYTLFWERQRPRD